MMHIITALPGGIGAFPGAWCVWLMLWGFVMYVVFILLHIYYVPPFLSYINQQRGAGCICDAVEVGELEDDVDEEVKVAFDIAIKEREAECLRQCPPIAAKCTIIRTDDMTDYEFEQQCAEQAQELADR